VKKVLSKAGKQKGPIAAALGASLLLGELARLKREAYLQKKKRKS
tara:strand:- start:266 stop:400 length:135 start_codon:yes stop_codon:yes gene_type:complete